MPKNAQTTAQLNSLHMPARYAQNASSQASTVCWTENFQMYKLDLENAEEPEITLPTFTGSKKKQENSKKNIYFCFIDYAKALNCVDHNKLWKTLKEMGTPAHLTCLLRNLYAGQEATVRTGHGTTDYFKIGKGVHQGCILSPCLFNFYAECITWNAQLDESQAAITGRRGTKEPLDIFLKQNGEDELKSLLMRVKEESGAGEGSCKSHGQQGDHSSQS